MTTQGTISRRVHRSGTTLHCEGPPGGYVGGGRKTQGGVLMPMTWGWNIKVEYRVEEGLQREREVKGGAFNKGKKSGIIIGSESDERQTAINRR